MKYIDAEKLIANLERQKRWLKLLQGEDYGQSCRIAAYENIIFLIEVLQQEQPEVDLEKEIQKHLKECLDIKSPTTDIELIKTDVEYTVRLFYGLRNRALEEAARHVYESWMGGTMNDVRRDMVELGRVINARKK